MNKLELIDFIIKFQGIKTKFKDVKLKDYTIRCTNEFFDVDKDFINNCGYVFLYTHKNIKITEVNTKDIIDVTESK